MLVGVVVNGQPSTPAGTYICTFTDPEVLPNDKFRVIISVTASNTPIAPATATTFPFVMGSTNFRFNFNKLALSNLVVTGDAFLAPDFGTTTTNGTSYATGTGSVNTIYSGAANAGTLSVGATPVPMVTLEFNIIDATQNAVLLFRPLSGGNPRTTALDDDKITTLIQAPFPVPAVMPLPIELVSFTAQEKDNVNEILWETSTEENVRIFVVERSLNGSDWTKLGEAAPNKSMRYSMLDRNPAKTTYYRLRNIDNDGQTELSQMVVVNRKNKDSKGIKFTASPNPVADVVKITFDNAVKGSVTTNIMNVSGQVVHTQLTAALAKDAEVTTYDVNMSDLPAGTYFFQVSTDTEEFVQTIVKQ